MDNSYTQTDTEHQPDPSIIERIAMPLLVFSGSLFVLLLLSLLFVIPRFTSVKVAGETYSPKAAAAYEQKLRASLLEQEDTRRNLVIPTHDALYERLKEEKRNSFGLDDVRAVLLSSAAQAEAADALTIASISMDEDGLVRVIGSIGNVGFRSMTVLAAFTEVLANDSRIQDFSRPAFTRETDQDGALYSPFTLSFSFVD